MKTIVFLAAMVVMLVMVNMVVEAVDVVGVKINNKWVVVFKKDEPTGIGDDTFTLTTANLGPAKFLAVDLSANITYYVYIILSTLLGSYISSGAGTLYAELPATDTVTVTTTASPPPPPTNTGDINGDKVVDIIDLTLLAQAWLSVSGEPRYNANCDINKDGRIDITDFTLLAMNWLRTYL